MSSAGNGGGLSVVNNGVFPIGRDADADAESEGTSDGFLDDRYVSLRD